MEIYDKDGNYICTDQELVRYSKYANKMSKSGVQPLDIHTWLELHKVGII